jgi:hypothetical protein
MLRILLAGKRGNEFRRALEAELPSFSDDDYFNEHYNDALYQTWVAFRTYDEWVSRTERVPSQSKCLTQNKNPGNQVRTNQGNPVTDRYHLQTCADFSGHLEGTWSGARTRVCALFVPGPNHHDRKTGNENPKVSGCHSRGTGHA